MVIKISRRSLLLGATATPLLAQTRPTPLQTLGPFFPADRSWDGDADLSQVKGKPGRAKGDLLYVTGRVLDLSGEPIRGAKLEIWQANGAGKYRHGADENPAPLDPNFEGYAEVTTDAEGRYRFKTVKPAAYPVGNGTTRPPHIHFDVAGASSRLVTQMYFPGEALNETDNILQRVRRKQALIAKITGPEKEMEAESRMALWDIVLNQRG